MRDFSVPIPSRAVWFHAFIGGYEPVPSNPDQIRTWPSLIKAAGFDAVFAYITQGYLEALMLLGDQNGQPYPSAYWKPKDGFTIFREECDKWNLQFHATYAPTQDLRRDVQGKHPGWITSGATIEVAEPEAFDRIMRHVEFIAKFYQPDGIQLEEPYYQDPPNHSHPAFVAEFKRRYGYDPTDLVAIQEHSSFADELAYTKKRLIVSMLQNIKSTVNRVSGKILLSANGPSAFDSPYIREGYDPDTWKSECSLNFLVPQNYSVTVENHDNVLNQLKARWSPLDLVDGIGLNWGGIDNCSSSEKQQVIERQIISAARGVSGTALFHWAAIDPNSTSNGFAAKLGDFKERFSNTYDIDAMCAVNEGVIVAYKDAPIIYCCPEARNLRGGGKAKLVYNGREKCDFLLPVDRGIIASFSGDSTHAHAYFASNANIGGGEVLYVGTRRVTSIVACRGWIITAFQGLEGVYKVPVGAQLDSGNHLPLRGNHVASLAAFAGGVIIRFATGSVYFSPDGENLDGGGQTQCVYVGSPTAQKIVRIVPFTGGFLTEFDSGYVYHSTNMNDLGSGEHAYNGGAENLQRVTAMIAFRDGVITAFTQGGVYYSPDGRHLNGANGTVRVFP